MGFKSNREMNETPNSKPCIQEEMNSKVRELKITKLLGDDTTELEKWVSSHYVPLGYRYNFRTEYGNVLVRNPAETIILIDYENNG